MLTIYCAALIFNPVQLVLGIKEAGRSNGQGQVQVTFRDLLMGREAESETLGGTLLTARKYQVEF